MNTLTRTPGRELNLLRREMDQLFNNILPSSTGERSSNVWMPPADLSETDDSFVLSIDLPGIPAENVEVTMEDDTLTINGRRDVAGAHKEGRFHRVERSYGRFFRSVQFGTPVDATAVDASFDDGVLSVRVAKSEASKPRRINVRSKAGMVEARNVDPSGENLETNGENAEPEVEVTTA